MTYKSLPLLHRVFGTSINHADTLFIQHCEGHQNEPLQLIKEKCKPKGKRVLIAERVFDALSQRCEAFPNDDYCLWISTRTLAEDSGLGIYQTRNTLLKLVDQGKAQVTPSLMSNTLRWYLSESAWQEQTRYYQAS